MLEEISMLPLSLRSVEAYNCPRLTAFPLPYSPHSCFKLTSQVLFLILLCYFFVFRYVIISGGGGGSILETRPWLAYYPKTDIHGVNHPNRCRILEAFFDSMCKYWAGKDDLDQAKKMWNPSCI